MSRKEIRKMLTKKQKLFCHLYQQSRNPKEAAALLGARRPLEAGLKMLGDREVAAEIERLCKKRKPQGDAAQGLRRIAFGSVADAIKLLRDWDTLENLEELDLFCVSEIKFSKSGGMEIKFFDRIKALEKLELIDSSQEYEQSLSPFVEAVREGARRLPRELGEYDEV